VAHTLRWGASQNPSGCNMEAPAGLQRRSHRARKASHLVGLSAPVHSLLWDGRPGVIEDEAAWPHGPELPSITGPNGYIHAK